MPDSTKAQETALAQQLLAGFQKHLANVTSLTLASVDTTAAQITTALQALLTLRAAVLAAQAVARAKVAAEDAQAPALRAIMVALIAYVKATYSASPDVLADFGLKPKKVPTPLTAAQKAVAAAKRLATRAARGITTLKAKKAVTGKVVDLAMTPVLAGTPVVSNPVAPTAAPAPAGTTSGTPVAHGS